MKKRGMIARAAAVMSLAFVLAGCTNAGGSTLGEISADKFVTLGAYTGLEIEVGDVSVDPEQLEAYVSSRMQSLQPMPVTGRAAQTGDVANIDFKGKMADTGEYFENGSGEGFDLILGSGMFIPGFEDAVVGMDIGSEKEIPLTFPAEYKAAELAGKDVIFKVKLNSLSAVSDESVKTLGIEGVSTMEELEAYLRGAYEEQIEMEHRADIENALCDKIESNSVFKAAPQEFQERMKTFYRGQIDYAANLYAQAYGSPISSSDLLSYIMSNDGFTGTEEEYVAKMALERANTYLMIDAIAEEQGISVTEEELMEHIEKALSESGYASVDEYKEKEDLDSLREQILYDKVMDYLIANNVIK